jgi:ABC-2 type transport system ATP-binding protein
VNGNDLAGLSEELSKNKKLMVAPFGNSLHVSSRDAKILETAIASHRKTSGLKWTKSEPSLEDVFIELMSRSKDNFQ